MAPFWQLGCPSRKTCTQVPKLRVLLVDDHTIVREGLRAILRYYDNVEIVGEAADGAEAVTKADDLHPDVVIIDIAMPRMNGIQATRLIRERFPGTRVIILSQHPDREYVTSALKAGASGYVLKHAAGADLIAALRCVARGEVFVHPSVSSAIAEEIRGDAVTLTPREREVLQLISDGHTSAQIAASLHLSVNTVNWHRTNLMTKVGAHNVAELIRYAQQNRLIQTSG
jgi:two-component system nitrate/nitrite response regulator NarL